MYNPYCLLITVLKGLEKGGNNSLNNLHTCGVKEGVDEWERERLFRNLTKKAGIIPTKLWRIVKAWPAEERTSEDLSLRA